MKPEWVDRAVFYTTQPVRDPVPELDRLAHLGINALCVLQRGYVIDPSTAALIAPAHQRDIRVCVDLSELAAERAAEEESVAMWRRLGVDGLKVHGAAGLRDIPADVVVVADQAETGDVRVDAVSTVHSTLFHSADGPCYFDSRGNGDFAPFWKFFEPLHRACGVDARLALQTSEAGEPALATGREGDDLEVIHTFLLTWPVVPFVRRGDEAGAGALLERLLYLRLTTPDLLPDASLRLLSGVSPGYPLVYRRGESIVVALNPSATARRVELEAVGDAAPLVARHCHLAHTNGRWSARLGPAGYGVFNVT